MPRSVSSISRATLTLAGSPPAQRVASRETSWFEPVQIGHAPSGINASVPSTTVRRAAASNGALMKTKLKPPCSSSRPVP